MSSSKAQNMYEYRLKKKTLIVLGTIACIGAFLGVLADFFSAWSDNPNKMATALSADIDSIKGLYQDKPRWTFVLGNFLGVFFLPIHLLGFYLIYLGLKPAGEKLALIFLVLGFYLIAIGVGFHGTLAFVGDIIQSNNKVLLNKMLVYWHPWGSALVIGYIVMSLYLVFLILRGGTLYSRWSVLISPLVVVIYSTVVIAILPENYIGIKAFLAVTGLNLPLLIFYGYITYVLVRQTQAKLEQ